MSGFKYQVGKARTLTGEEIEAIKQKVIYQPRKLLLSYIGGEEDKTIPFSPKFPLQWIQSKIIITLPPLKEKEKEKSELERKEDPFYLLKEKL